MSKRWISLFLCLGMLLGMPLCVWAEEAETEIIETVETVTLEISTREEFLAFAENCRLDTYSVNLTVSLENDIDLTGCTFESIAVFSGTFEGNGHRISGFHLTADGSVQGLFRYLTATAIVRDLHLAGAVQPGGSQSSIGAIAGRNEGKISGCSFSGTVAGGERVGGIAGTNALLGSIENCQVTGNIQGNHFVGGIAGENSGVIRSCTNEALINTTPQQNDVDLTHITVDGLIHTESANTATDIGGIAGISTGVIRSCENRGDIGYLYMGYNVGGIAGTHCGYLTGCQNYGKIQGRKEVGGIVGQMEPSSLMEYSQDTLQILRGQLNDLGGLVNQASANAQANAGYLAGQIAVLQDQVQGAKDAVDLLLGALANPEDLDPDGMLATLNALSANLGAMPETLRGIIAAAESTVDGLSRDLGAVSEQIGVMSATINGASENLGGTMIDLSDQDTPEQLTGKTELCANYGDVIADLNAGGIAGAMAAENDLDVLEDWEQKGEQSLNFQSQLRSVVLSCENYGKVTAKKQNVGGIVGWQSLGLVKHCVNTATVDGTDANYAGGISGLSTGFLRENWARCEIYGTQNVGGIAGSGTIVTDSLAQVKLTGAREKRGAILGAAEAPWVQEEQPIARNYYLSVEKDYGAIDGISYSGQAEPMALEAFMVYENLPELFQSVTVRFVSNEEVTELSVAPGETIEKEKIPAVPRKEGYTGVWDGLQETQLTNILFDMTFTAAYTPYRTTIQSQQTRDSGLPILLAEGSFTDDAAVSAIQTEEKPELGKKETLLETWKLSANEDIAAARFLLPEGADAKHIKLLGRGEDGNWKEISFSQVGSYLVFTPEGREMTLAVVEIPPNNLVIYLLASAVVLLGATAAIVLLSKKKKKPAQTEENNEQVTQSSPILR